MRSTFLRLALASVLLSAVPIAGNAAAPYRFTFAGPDLPGYTRVGPDTPYAAARGYGLEPGVQTAPGKPWLFSVDLAEGNYDVTVTLGDDKRPAVTTVKAELRRLMLENVATKAGETVQRTFTVNVRTPVIPAVGAIKAGRVKLSDPRETVREANAWDGRLTLEINGSDLALRSIAIALSDAPTVYLLGDSTVCDQRGEPFASWGQMLPRFFKPGVAVANHGQSGETYRGSLANRRIDKVAASIRPGDTVLLQFGHNDQKQPAPSGPFTSYKAELKQHIDMIQARGGVAVVVSPVERRRFDKNGKVTTTLDQYSEAARQTAKEKQVAFIDLHAMSQVLYQALGEEGSKAAFASRGPGHLDNTHHSPYGAYEIAKLVAHGMRQAGLPVAGFLSNELGPVDPAMPAPFSEFKVPPSPGEAAERPAGDEPSTTVAAPATKE